METRGLRQQANYERRYKDLMRSGAFLYALLDLKGDFLALNSGMRNFLGYGAVPETLLACCPLEQRKEMHGLLKEGAEATVAALIPLALREGDQVWMDVELSPSELRGKRVIQLVGTDVTEWTQASGGGELSAWGCVLDSCPGLLCCVLDSERKLLYASPGYRALALRVLGHSCDVGRSYPPMADSSFRHLLEEALQGRTDSLEIPEKDGRRWDFMAAPLWVNNEASGAVLRVLPVQQPLIQQPRQQQPQQNASVELEALLNAVAIPAVVVDGQGTCLAANDAFPAAAGKPLTELISPDNSVNADFHRQLFSTHSSTCRLDTEGGEVLWWEASARPLKWAGAEAMLVTFTDVTRLRRAQEQLARREAVDPATGILNRENMERRVLHDMEQSFRDGSSLALTLLEVNGLRQIMEEEGYVEANRKLKALAAMLQQAEGAVGRWGEDKFMVLARAPLVDALKEQAQGLGLSLNAGAAELKDGMDVPAFVGAAYDAMIRDRKGGAE